MLVLKCVRGAILGAIGGFIAFLVVGIPLQILVGLIMWDSNKGAAAGSLAALAVPAGIAIGIWAAINEETERRQRAEAAEAARRQRHIEEQQGYRTEMLALGERSMGLFESIPAHLRTAEEHLDQAEVDFAEGVFAPFWDSVERAAQTLGRFDEGVRQINGNSSQYAGLIKQYDGAPPEFPLSAQSVAKLAVGAASAERMKVIVRTAQRDFQFSVIYEQRKTNQILVAGFTNLAQALDQMTWRITTSIDDLATSVDAMRSTVSESMVAIHSQIGDIAAATARHQHDVSAEAAEHADREKTVIEMLNNIQHRRRPSH